MVPEGLCFVCPAGRMTCAPAASAPEPRDATESPPVCATVRLSRARHLPCRGGAPRRHLPPLSRLPRS
eukprot:COSAG01_NODE_20137_length_969_cov_1.071264_2_plen_67_part_01